MYIYICLMNPHSFPPHFEHVLVDNNTTGGFAQELVERLGRQAPGLVDEETIR